METLQFPHAMPPEQALKALDVDFTKGLSPHEVGQRRQKFGFNRVSQRHGTPAWLKFLRQFNQPLVYILLLACIITGFLEEWIDSAVILGVVIINAIVGFLQEAKAEKAIEALAQMIAVEATVRRGGQQQRIDAGELVPGDVVVLRAGDRVPADLRLVRARNVHSDESALTGESVPVDKHVNPVPRETILAERANLVFAGTFITSGEAEGVVIATGDESETGRIAQLIFTSVELTTPLTRKIAHFSKLVLWVIVVLAAVTFAVGVARGERPVAMFTAAVALAVGAIPEGLPAAVTIVLAIGVSRLARRKAIIRRLPAVETLGSTTVICSDKTGTLTKNQMTVQEILAGGRLYTVSGAGYEPSGGFHLDGAAIKPGENSALEECLRAGVLCNESQVLQQEGQAKVQGDPTEAALVVAGEKAGLHHAETRRAAPRIGMIPFDSEHMFRATLHEMPAGGGARVIYVVGAAERLLPRCADSLGERGEPVPLDQKAAQRAMEQMAARGLRVLALARRQVDSSHATVEHEQVAEGLTFLGLQGMIDPPRPEAIAAVRQCQRAGIAVKMITGDHLVTARAIAKQIGLSGLEENGQLAALSGRDLEKTPDEQLAAAAERTAVFARVAPEQKLRLIRALQARGHVVAMTGDGVNDAPALKQADIGVAMGHSGTDVARGAAAMILTDDNFATIEAAVEEGRGVFDNLTKFIVWIIPTNFGEAMMLLATILLGLPLPLLPLQILWINLTDTLLGLSLAFEPAERGVMSRPPRDPRRPLLTFPLIMRTGLVAIIMVAGALGVFLWELNTEQSGITAARTAVINVLVLVQIVYLFNCRSLQQFSFAAGLRTNPWTFAGAAVMLGAQLLLNYAPVMNRLFHTAPLSAEAWLRIAAVAVIAFITVEIEKWIRFRRNPREIPSGSKTPSTAAAAAFRAS